MQHLLVASVFWGGASGVAFTVTPEDVMNDMHTEEHLQLLQLSARRHQQNVEKNAAPGVLAPEDTQGPYVTLDVNTECPEDQILTLRQCTQAAWSGVLPDQGNQPQTYGAINLLPEAPAGCFIWVGRTNNQYRRAPPTFQVYYNANPTGRPDPGYKPVCSVNGGRQAELAQEVTLPTGGVEQLPASTECDECGVLSLDQCKLAAETLGLASAMRFAWGWPLFTTFQNEHSFNRAVDQQPAPRGCTIFNNNLVYWNQDSTDDFYKSAPHHWRRPICGVCDPTTTTTTTPAPPQVEPAGDAAEAVGDPHITTNEGEHFDMQY